jgi:serine/threonine-protein kinase
MATKPIAVPSAPPAARPAAARPAPPIAPTILADEPPPVSRRQLSSPDASADHPKRCPTCGNFYPQDFLLCPRDATPLDVPGAAVGDPLLDKILNDTYRIVRLVGEGGMGKVYEAHHLRLGGKRVAVKVLHPELATKADIVARFQREAESASAIDHPNVVEVFDVHRMADGTPYLVGEFLEGEELGKQVERAGRLSPPAAVAIGRQVCKALGAAHARGVVHRDMKPENVFLVQRGGETVAKVLDFGISKAEQRETHLTKTGLIMGTPSYMAPEQARGEKVDLRADIYAVGALLYNLVTGRAPFVAQDAGTTLTLVLTQEPDRPRAVVPDVPEGLEIVIQRAMAKDPRDRFQTMAELDAALAPFDARSGATAMTGAPPPMASLPPPAKEQMDRLGLDGTARRVVEAGFRAMTGSHQLPGREVKFARPAIIGLSVTLAVWLLGGFVAAVGGIVRAVRGISVGELTTTETVLLVLGTLLAAATPGFLYVQHLRKTVWPNSVRAVQLAADLWRTAAAAFVTYGVVALVGRILFTVLAHSSHALASGVWDAGLFFASLVVALVAGGIGPLARTFKRRAAG